MNNEILQVSIFIFGLINMLFPVNYFPPHQEGKKEKGRSSTQAQLTVSQNQQYSVNSTLFRLKVLEVNTLRSVKYELPAQLRISFIKHSLVYKNKAASENTLPETNQITPQPNSPLKVHNQMKSPTFKKQVKPYSVSIVADNGSQKNGSRTNQSLTKMIPTSKKHFKEKASQENGQQKNNGIQHQISELPRSPFSPRLTALVKGNIQNTKFGFDQRINSPSQDIKKLISLGASPNSALNPTAPTSQHNNCRHSRERSQENLVLKSNSRVRLTDPSTKKVSELLSQSNTDFHIKTFIRFKPRSKEKTRQALMVNNNLIDCNSEDQHDKKIAIIDGNKILFDDNNLFTYDHVFEATVSQQNIYSSVASDMVDHFLAGFNSTILTYGQTGSGKTYTMFGPHKDCRSSPFSSNQTLDQQQQAHRQWKALQEQLQPFGAIEKDDGEQMRDSHSISRRGIVPNAIHDIFLKKEKGKSSRVHQSVEDEADGSLICCSMLEIYKENLIDLLADPQPLRKPSELKIKQNKVFNVSNLTVKEVHSEAETLNILKAGNQLKKIRQTCMNETSSRSHVIFTVYLTVRKEGRKRLSKFNFVDLAGSQKVSKSKVQGDGLQEVKKINLSLSCLGNTINALLRKNDHVPYRESKLTRLLYESLGGNSLTRLIVTCSSKNSQSEETLSSLKFASRAKNLKTNPLINTLRKSQKSVSRVTYENLKKSHTENQRKLAQIRAIVQLERINFEASAQKNPFKKQKKRHSLLKQIVDAMKRQSSAQSSSVSDPEPQEYNDQGILSKVFTVTTEYGEKSDEEHFNANSHQRIRLEKRQKKTFAFGSKDKFNSSQKSEKVELWQIIKMQQKQITKMSSRIQQLEDELLQCFKGKPQHLSIPRPQNESTRETTLNHTRANSLFNNKENQMKENRLVQNEHSASNAGKQFKKKLILKNNRKFDSQGAPKPPLQQISLCTSPAQSINNPSQLKSSISKNFDCSHENTEKSKDLTIRDSPNQTEERSRADSTVVKPFSSEQTEILDVLSPQELKSQYSKQILEVLKFRKEGFDDFERKVLQQQLALALDGGYRENCKCSETQTAKWDGEQTERNRLILKQSKWIQILEKYIRSFSNVEIASDQTEPSIVADH